MTFFYTKRGLFLPQRKSFLSCATWNCFSLAKLHRAVRGGQAGGLRWPETLRLQPQVYIFCTSPQGLVVARFSESPSCKVVKLFTYLQRQEVEATWDFEATDPRSDKSGSSGGRVALLPRSTWELSMQIIRLRAESWELLMQIICWRLRASFSRKRITEAKHEEPFGPGGETMMLSILSIIHLLSVSVFAFAFLWNHNQQYTCIYLTSSYWLPFLLQRLVGGPFDEVGRRQELEDQRMAREMRK